MANYDPEITELELYIDNDYYLVGRENSQKHSIEKNLKLKAKTGRYMANKAPKLWQYLVDEGARKYCKEYNCSVRTTFPVKLRMELARRYAREFEATEEFKQAKAMRNNPLSKTDVTQMFVDDILPTIEKQERTGRADKPMRRQEWGHYIDGLQRGGMITAHQADTWTMPSKLLTRRKSNPCAACVLAGLNPAKKNPKHTRPDKPRRKPKKGAKAKPYARSRKGGGARKNPVKKGTSVRSLVSQALK